jgi:cell division septation protein DedD
VAPSDNPADPYRVSVGAFGARENAERQAARFRDAGYPVFLASQGDFTIVLVGPYASEAEARVVRDAIDASEADVDPIIYMYSEDEDSEGEGAAPSPAPSEADEPPVVDVDETPAVAQSQSGTRLQVGAFDDGSSAQPAIERLEAIGFNVDEVNENGMLKLVVGPFTGDALQSARSLLDQAGFEHFAR